MMPDKDGHYSLDSFVGVVCFGALQCGHPFNEDIVLSIGIEHAHKQSLQRIYRHEGDDHRGPDQGLGEVDLKAPA